MYTLLNTKDSYVNELGTTIKGASYFLCDGVDETDKTKDTDIENLPKTVGVGSRALCIPTGHIYMFGPSGEWVLYKGVSILN